MHACLLRPSFVHKCSPFIFRKPGESTMFSANHINTHVFKLQRELNFFRRIIVMDHPGIMFPNSVIHKTIHNYKILNGQVGLSWSYSGAYARHLSSKIPSDAWGSKNGLNSRRRSSGVENIVISEKAFQNANSQSSIPVKNSLNGGVKDANSRTPTSRPALNKHSEPSDKKATNRQHLGKKKSTPVLLDATAISNADQSKGSGRVSPSKRPNNAKKGEPSQASGKNSPGGLLRDVGSNSKKTSKKSARKGNHVKETVADMESDECLSKLGQNDMQFSCNHESPQKQEAQMDCNTDRYNVRAKLKFKHLYPPTGKSVVVVESFAKAKVIQGYLGDMYEVVASCGHVRDLAARSGSVRPDDGFSMLWEVPSTAWTHLKSIMTALNRAENLIIASDPDREGEAIGWHIIEMLQQQGVLHKVSTIARVVFHEITESAIKNALLSPRNINENLVNAYLARRALDYLIGFNISPLLWRKLPGCPSAGRVQSAALSLICDREMEVDKFKPREYWSIEVEFKKDDKANSPSFHSLLSHIGSQRLKQHSIKSQAQAKDMEEGLNLLCFKVVASKRNTLKKKSPPPYITSTLQQDASNRLHFTAAHTMKVAQKLYEGVQLANGKETGLITYMRTDGLNLSNEAAMEIHSLVVERYGPDFAAENARKYFKKVKNAQEAHEAIRPTDIRLLPSMLTGILDEDSLKLYSLIWCRTMACQMVSASIDQIHLDIGSSDKSVMCQSTSSKVGFLGYRIVYKDEAEAFRYNENDGNDSEAFAGLSLLKVGDQLHLDKVELRQHHTQPPLRYSEASLVKKLEALGIGRPSTYASTLKVLQDRNYVTIKTRVLHPEFRGRMVSAYLLNHFSEVTNYNFTANMEAELDNVSTGATEWRSLLDAYWKRFSNNCDLASRVDVHQVEKMLEATFGDILFSSFSNESRKCPCCMKGTLRFKVSRYGSGYFIGCDQHPKCKYIVGTSAGSDDDVIENEPNSVEPKVLGVYPGSNEKVILKSGPYGFYLQLGESRKGHTPKRASLSQMKDVSSMDLEKALEFLRFPLTLGNHPVDKQPVEVRLSKKGYSIKHRNTIAPVPKDMTPSNISLDEALKVLAGKDAKRFGRPKKNVRADEAALAL